MQYLSLKNLCSFLSISVATGRNWLALGKLTPTKLRDGTPVFSEEYAVLFREQLLSGKNTALKQRRNKNFVSGTASYASYLPAASPNRNLAKQLCGLFKDSTPPDEVLLLLLAEYALQLYVQAEKRGFCAQTQIPLLGACVNDNTLFPEFALLLNDLLPKKTAVHKFIKTYEKAFFLPVTYVPSEDTLGFLYLSLRALSERKASGAYYTPEGIVKQLIAELGFDNPKKDSRTAYELSILDPSCGTGNFLIHLPATVPLSSIYGSDTDKTAVALTRINLFLRYLPEMSSDDSHPAGGNFSATASACGTPSLTRKKAIALLRSHITVSDYLLGNDNRTYTHILGNPPWGSSFSGEETALLKQRFSSVTGSVPEAYDLFIEQSVKRLVDSGSFSFVLPEALLSVKAHKAVRRLLLSCCRISSLAYLGNCFDKVYCPCVLLTAEKTGSPHSCIGMRVTSEDGHTFTIAEERNLSADGFCLSSDDTVYRLLARLLKTPGCVSLKDNADFALGIVTGDNKSKLIPYPTGDNPASTAQTSIPILRGPDIAPYHLSEPSQALSVPLSACQQAAPEHLYFAPEKLVYRFISDRLVFAYDDKGTLLLNSCNLLIPQIPGLSAKYVLAVLNSRVMQFIYREKFHSVKVLRSHLEQLPIPQASKKEQEEILSLVNKLMEEPYGSKAYLVLYEELEATIGALFGLDAATLQFLSTYRT